MDRQKPLVRVGIQPVYEHGRYKLIYTLPEPGEYKLIASHQNSVFFNGSIAPIRVSPRRHPALPRQECGSRKDIAAALQKSGYWKNDVFYPQCDIQQSKTLCADLQGKDIKRVAIIGDSLSRHLFVTVVSMLSDKGTITDDEVFLLLLGDNPSEGMCISVAPLCC